MASAVAAIRPAKIASLIKTRCAIFQTAYNPTSARTGAKYLRARLRGPSMVKYYPPEVDIAAIVRQWPELELINYAEETRLQDVEDKKKRGKGAPKKTKRKEDSRRSNRKR
ncbi:mitochondrial ribosomal subunit S27-domain-containing protein [Hygrophoropsis aurantiaca]|uniref:Mitochondrial ribosomal subunit S27-domain-containing protein n=1 Tax=Hygrophoropsis aurantiaca TaxID=72124 RepID=A0ACB7ZX00_9AGAM|nr:mitochondrial ribosomal subunit S27-domain-containing protein [Hygrophoropsis aurantiaca]